MREGAWAQIHWLLPILRHKQYPPSPNSDQSAENMTSITILIVDVAQRLKFNEKSKRDIPL